MDARLAVRAIQRRWAASTAIVLTTGLSAAVTLALFAVVDGLVFRPLPFPAPDRLVAIDYRRDPGGRPADLAFRPDLAGVRDALRQRLEHYPGLAGTAQAGFAQFFSTESARESGLEVTGVDASFFDVFGQHLEVGVALSVDDELSPAATDWDSPLPLPVVLGHDLATSAFGSPRLALGLHDLAGRRVRVVGVMPPGVKFPGETNVWAPVSSSRDRIPAYARLRSSATVAALAGAFPDLDIRPLREAVRVGNPQALEVLFVASGLLLLLTWAQVSALVLMGALTDVRTIGVMQALGAGRARLVRQAMLQNGVLVAAASLLAGALLPEAHRFITVVIPPEFRDGQYLAPDARTLMFGAVLALAGFVLLAAIPALVAGRATPLGVLSGRIGDRPASMPRVRRALLMVQMAATAFLLYLSGLTLHSFTRAATFDYGFEPDNLLLFTVPNDWARRDDTPERSMAAFKRNNATVEDTLDVLGSLPGVSGAAGFFQGPLATGVESRFDERVPVTSFDGRPRPDVVAEVDDVSLDFARTLQLRILAGHVDPVDSVTTRNVMVNRALADQLVGMRSGDAPVWASVIGHEVKTSIAGGRIVAVVENLVLGPPGTPVVPQLFEMQSKAGAFEVIATRVTPQSAPSVQAALERLWGHFSPRKIEWMRDAWQRAMTPYRSQALLLAVLAAAGVPIAALGLIGALVEAVRNKRPEIAVRLVVGASPSDIRTIVLRQALVPVAFGLGAGVALAATVSVSLRHQLFEVQPLDGVTVIAVVAGMALIAGAAAVIPALQASRVEPSTLLRSI